MLRKSQPNFQHYVIKIEAQTKKQFSYKKRVEQKTRFNFALFESMLRSYIP